MRQPIQGTAEETALMESAGLSYPIVALPFRLVRLTSERLKQALDSGNREASASGSGTSSKERLPS